jgi:phosphatidylserine/phosphatidylglycerophosphate/cardiolipin synthase-like enzyme
MRTLHRSFWRLLMAISVFWLLAAGISTAFAAPVNRALFSPWDDVEGELIALIDQSQVSVQLQAYLLTSRPLANALRAAHRRGVAVQILADAEMAKRGGETQLALLAQAGLSVDIETRYAAAHNKVIILDLAGTQPVLVTGSYNFTWSAQARNAENVLIISGDKDLAQRYADNWRRHQADAMPYGDWINAARPTQRDQVKRHAK